MTSKPQNTLTEFGNMTNYDEYEKKLIITRNKA